MYNIPLSKPYIKLHIEHDGAHDQIFQDLSPFFLGGAWDEATGRTCSLKLPCTPSVMYTDILSGGFLI